MIDGAQSSSVAVVFAVYMRLSYVGTSGRGEGACDIFTLGNDSYMPLPNDTLGWGLGISHGGGKASLSRHIGDGVETTVPDGVEAVTTKRWVGEEGAGL